MSTPLLFCSAIILICSAVCSSVSTAQETKATQESPSTQDKSGAAPYTIHIPTPPSPKIIGQRVTRLLSERSKLLVSQVLDSILLMIVEDIRGIKLDQASPIALRGITVRPPLSSSLSDWVDHRLTAYLHNRSGFIVKTCSVCRRQRTSIKDDRWLFTYGVIRPSELASLSTAAGIQSFLDLDIRWSTDQNHLDVSARLVNSKQEELWSERYSSGNTSQPALRDRSIQETQSRYYQLKTLYDVESAKVFTEVNVGGGFRSGQSQSGLIFKSGIGRSELFGDLQRWQLAFLGSISTNTRTFFVDLETELRYRLDSGTISEQTPAEECARGLWVKGSFGVPFSLMPAGLLAGVGLSFMSKYHFGGELGARYAFAFDEQDRGGIAISLSATTIF